MPGKAFVMAFVWSGWLIASVIAFLIVAYAGFFGMGVIGLMIWFVTARVDMEHDGVVGAGVSPGFLAQQLQDPLRDVACRASGASWPAVAREAVDTFLPLSRNRAYRLRLRRLPAVPDLEQGFSGLDQPMASP